MMKDLTMYDCSIKEITPEVIQARGADAYDRGLGIDDHGMNPWVPAVADWKLGWINRRNERRTEHNDACVDQLLAMAMVMTK